MNTNNTSNRFEKFGEAWGRYGANCPEQEIVAKFKAVNKVFEELGHIYREYSVQIEEQIIAPLHHWTKVGRNLFFYY